MHIVAHKGMTKLVKNVYFDESGFTGNNLLSKDQPFFNEIFYWQCCVVPTPENLDPKNVNNHLNRYILQEIAERSRNSTPVLDDIEKDIIRISRTLAMLR